MDGTVVIGTELDTKGFEKEIVMVEEKLNDVEQTLEMASSDKTLFSTREIKEMEVEAEKLKNKLITLKQKQEDIDFSKAKYSLEDVGNGISAVTKKVGKWALAVFGIRSAYMMIRQAINTIASEDDQIATDIEYMKWVLAQTLKPVVEWLIQALYYVIALINSISKQILNVNLLTGKSAEDFKNMKKNSAGVSKNLADAKKQLAGFDEMNVLSDNSAGGGAGSGIEDWEAPDLSKYEKEVEQLGSAWQKFGEEMKETLDNTPIEMWFGAFGKWGLAVRGVTEFVYGLWEAVSGVVQFIKGVVQLIYGLITGDTEKIKEGIINMLDGLWHVIDGLLHAIAGLIEMVVGLIIGIVWWLVEKIVDFVKWCWETDVAILSKVGDWIYKNIIKPVADFFTGLWNGIVDGVKNAVNSVKNFFNSIPNFFKGIIDKIMGFFTSIGTNVGNAIGGAFKGVVNGVLSAIEWVLNTPIKTINKLIDTVNKLPGVNLGKLGTFNLPRLAKGGIVNMPGRGVPVGSAIAGERGQEAVLPLTDSQQMDLLGASIGKHITINANITTTMNGRVISKELQKIQAENDFAYNR